MGVLILQIVGYPILGLCVLAWADWSFAAVKKWVK